MTRGEIYRTGAKTPERGHKPGFYVVVSRGFIAGNDDISTVICAPIYSETLGIRSEVLIGPDEGVPQESAIRCDFLTLMFKSKLTGFVGVLSRKKEGELDAALAYALGLRRPA
ncbi:MAG TPA: type II toxin-antitoxin system PemK/MazF family toxin [Terriglobia bacterium]|nr:type II toxin-antitoxin system PemK/MazF family toxin [Terriglobia bacterium]